MHENIVSYIAELNKCYATGVAREHAYRPALQNLMRSLLPSDYTVVNEPARTDCGAPDFIIIKGDIPMAFIEAKDLQDTDLDGKKEHKEQFERYRSSLDHIVFTDYLDFHLYENGEFIDAVRLADVRGEKIVLNQDAINKFLALINRLANAAPQRITSASRLAQIMAGKARLLRDIIEQALVQDGDNPTELCGYMEAFRQVLIHDITPKAFADIYAQTISYGMFAARLHDDTPENFTRAEAANLIPKTNPFLRKVFQQIAGYDLDERIAWIVDDLVNAFAATDMGKIMQGFGKSTQQTDPMLHFYEDFLFQYEPAVKKQCGVYYTPQPVVEFIVRAVDDILRLDFGLPMGLADTSKVEMEQTILQDSKHRKEKVQKHRVQVLDPATGTGTFLAETVRQIKRDLGGQMGAWSSYVPEHLLPRLHGFELMMAPYTIAHLKLDMEINSSEGFQSFANNSSEGFQSFTNNVGPQSFTNSSSEGFQSFTNNGSPQSFSNSGDVKHRSASLLQQRLCVYLTNSLEESNADVGTLFGSYLAQEANEASRIKQSAPVMIVMGNPPYSVSSNNKGEWISRLLDDYKKNLNERNIQPLSDDYIKFIRLAQYYVERNGEGIVAYISNNSFIDGLIHRQMRSELMRVFDKIYILDLHGNTRKKEVCSDGSKDENLFDIMQGVSINIFVKKAGKSNAPAQVRHFDLYGTRRYKYEYLNQHTLQSVEWQTLNPQEPMLFFVPKDFSLQEEYDKGFKVDELMKVNACGIVSSRDSILIKHTKTELLQIKQDFLELTEEEFRKKYNVQDSRDWTYHNAKDDIKKSDIIPIAYRPFDNQYVFYTSKSKGVLSYPRYEIMQHMLRGDNISFNICKQQSTFDFQHIIVSQYIIDKCTVSSQTKEAGYIFPLYLYSEEGMIEMERKANLNPEIVARIASIVGNVSERCQNTQRSEALATVEPEDIFDYIYGVLHSPAYRAKYKEFLKVDFPRIPYPKDAAEFEHYRGLGHELRELHLMHNVPASPVAFPEAGSMVVEQIAYDGGNVRINSNQYFANVPVEAWTFYIGGYQPAQKWLKDRKGRTLSFDDINHYRNIIAVLLRTAELMREIDRV